MTRTAVSPHRILLVDDEEALRRLFRRVLERSGDFEVVGEAEDGSVALDQARMHLPDVVMLDLSMPVMDGLEALPHLRRILPDARLVVVSGFTAAGAGEAALRAGADAYLEKGLAPQEFLTSLHAAIRGAAIRGAATPRDPVAAEPPRRLVKPSSATLDTSEVVARLAHDVRSPLSMASASLDYLASALDSDIPEDVRALIDAAAVGLTRAERTLNAAVEHARTGQAPLEPGEVVLRDVVRDVVGAAASEDHRLSVVGDGAVRAFADADAVQRVLGNLVENALRHTAGAVEVEVSVEDSSTVIEVRDEGPGLGRDPDRLFDPFVRGASGAGVAGSGLGLATAADLVRRMSGELTAQDLPGRGAVFRVTLPRA